MRFAEPWYLLLFTLLLLFIFLRPTGGGRIIFSSIERFQKLQGRKPFQPRIILKILRILTFLFFVLALARPQSGREFSEITSEGVDILLVLDTSGSMEAMDFQLEEQPVTRLAMVKKVAAEFVEKRAGDRIGIVVFGEEAFTQCPLTLDHDILNNFLEEINIGMAGDATAIGSALGIGVQRMKKIKAKSRIMILLTDGRNNAGRIQPDKAAELARTFGIKTYTIGVGGTGPAPFLVDSPFGKRFIRRNVDLDEQTLQTIARTTDAQYYRATDTAALRKIYDRIDQLEKTKVEIKEYTEYNELYHLFLLPGLILLLTEIILNNTKLRKIP